MNFRFSRNSRFGTDGIFDRFQAKTRLQAQSVPYKEDGKRQYRGAWSLLKSLWKEGGIAAVYRGWYINIPRIFMGSAIQLTTFGLSTDWLASYEVHCIVELKRK